MSVKPIANPLHGERVLAMSPETATAAATDWLRRPNMFAGRALTAATLGQRQAWQAGRIAIRTQAFTPGVVAGLEVSSTIEGGGADAVVRLHIRPGRALTATGEDVVLASPVDLRLSDLPVVAEPAIFAEAGGATPPVPPSSGGLGVLHPRAIGSLPLGQLTSVRRDILPPIGVLVLQPVLSQRSDFDAEDPCDRCRCADDKPSLDSYEDWRTADGVRVLWYAWPDEWRALPPPGPRRRNTLAHAIFDAEAALAPGDVLPWEEWGAPIALVGVDAEWRPVFEDRASVVRQGGRARDARLIASGGRLAPNSRLPALWQARIEQLAEQLAEAGEPMPDAPTLAQAFARLPPAGLLPTSAVTLDVLPLNLASEVLQSRFFPSGFELDAVPVPLTQLDVAIREAAPLASLDFSAAERVRVLVPVTQASFEPRLLFEETVDAEFQQTIDRFALTRARSLGARHGLRLHISALTGAINGVAPAVTPPDADPLALEPESLGPWGPPPAGGGHRSVLAPGLHQHEFAGATATLSAVASAALYTWIHVDPEHPPQSVMLQWHAGGGWEHRAYWGANVFEVGIDATPSRLQLDARVPAPGRWVRLVVDAASVGLSRATPIDGMAFTVFDGRAVFGASGVANGTEDNVWFSGAPPAGATLAGNEPWEFLTQSDLWAPFEPVLGTGSALPALETLRQEPSLAPLSTAERAQLDARGVDGFIAYLKARADRADDLVDYGFIKVQTDVYRVRQLVLGTTAATRLAVSPALAAIAQADTAVASQEQISTFYKNLTGAVTPSTLAAVAPRTRSRGGPGSGSTPAAFETVASVAPAVATESTPGARAATPRATLATSSALFAGVSSGPTFRADTNVALDPRRSATDTITNVRLQDGPVIRLPTQETGVIGTGIIVARPPTDVINATPIVGKANIRTTAIAQRLEDPKAIEAKDYAAATRHEAVAALVRLAEELRAQDGGVTPGLFEGIDVYGVRDDAFLGANNATRRLPLSAFVADRTRLTQLLTTPIRSRPVPNATETLPDEGAYFSDSADLSDNTVALMRQLEGRIKLYRDAIAAAQRTADTLRNGLARATARLAAADDSLAEARHDVSVARALLAEESERIAGINSRRAAVLREEVRFLAFVRPRESDNLVPATQVPRRQLDPGLTDAPVPACLDDHPDTPDELTAILRVVREAPAAWFAEVPALFERLDRPDLLVKVLQSTMSRTHLLSAAAQPATANRVTSAMFSMQARQLQTVAEARSRATHLDLSRVRGVTWQVARDEATQVVSLGDLMDGEHGRGEVARRAAQTFEQIGRIAACLHGAFSGVAPSIRLDWAETLSQFDDAPSLRRLGALRRWSEIPFTDRHQLQSLADWLFARINPREPRAEGLMNDVVRMCLLLASHAPVGRILAGRLPRPVTVRPGVRLPLTAFDPARLRVGMEAVIYRQAIVVARAIVEDIGGTEISARVVNTVQPQIDLDVDVRVQFGAAASLSRSAAVKAVLGAR